MLKVSVTHDIVAQIGSFSLCSSVHSTDREVFCYIRMLSASVEQKWPLRSALLCDQAREC